MSRRIKLVMYVVVLLFYLYAFKANAALKHKLDPNKIQKQLRELGKFGLYFFTLWNFALQTYFICTVVLDEILKVVNPESKFQKVVQRARHFIFTTLVFPCSLVVVTVFWTLWHVDRELIFPRALDEFYPTWLNHTLHTFIVIPLILELVLGGEGRYYNSKSAVVILLGYLTVYQSLFMSVYLRYGVWLYPIYGVLNWTQRILFTLLQVTLSLCYQKLGIFLLSTSRRKKATDKTM